MTGGSTSPSAGLAPVTAAERIVSLDVLRGVAVLGILLMNIGGFASNWVESPLGGDPGALDRWTWIITGIGFEGTMRGLFSLLFGAGVILLTSRAEAAGRGAQIADVYYRRTIWLLLFGVVHGYVMLWPGDILYAYGVVGLFLFPLRRLRPRTLIIAGCIVLALMVPRSLYERAEVRGQQAEAQRLEALAEAGEPLTEEQQESVDGWSERVKTYDFGPQDFDIVDIRRSGYLRNFVESVPIMVESHTKELYFWLFWDALGMMLVGMGLMKLDVLGAGLPRRTYLLMALIGYPVGLTVNTLETVHLLSNDGSIVAMYDTYPTYDVARLAMTLGHVGVVMLLCQARVLPALLRRLAAVGRMALSNYLLQTVICVLLFYGVGFGLHDRLGRFELKLVVLGIWIVQLVVSPIWLRAFRFGPAEWLWRSLTYVRLQPMRVTPTTRPPAASPP